MVQIEMRIAEGVDEIARLQAGRLGHHVGEERIGRDVEGDAEKNVRRALVELAGQPPFRDIELEQAMAGRERHLVEFGRVPGRDDEAAAVGVAADLVEHPADLVDAAAVGLRPGAPCLP